MTLNADISQIESIEAARAKAILEADADVLDSITDDDYVHVEAFGTVRTKDEFVSQTRNRTGRYESYVVSQNQIRIFADTAVVTGLLENSYLKADGDRVVKRARHIRVYVRRADGWKNVSHQATLCA